MATKPNTLFEMFTATSQLTGSMERAAICEGRRIAEPTLRQRRAQEKRWGDGGQKKERVAEIADARSHIAHLDSVIPNLVGLQLELAKFVREERQQQLDKLLGRKRRV